MVEDLTASIRDRMHVLMVVLVVGLVACSSSPKPKPDETATEEPAPPARPGTDRWEGIALELPDRSPITAVARAGDILDGVRRLKNWLVAQPDMLGEDGQAMTDMVKMRWQMFITLLGDDPTDSGTWADRGLDTTRPIYFGVYPVNDEGSAFIEKIESTLREELELGEDEEILAVLQQIRDDGWDDVPEGLNSRLLRAVEGYDPVTGARILVPTTDSLQFMEGVTEAAAGIGYERFATPRAVEMGLGAVGRAFYTDDASLPAFSLKLAESHVIVDLVVPAFEAGTLTLEEKGRTGERQMKELVGALASMQPGRPAAPRPIGDPTAAVSADQTSTSELAKLRGYRRALESIRMASMQERDSILAAGLLETQIAARNWQVRDEKITGLSYSFTIEQPNAGRIFSAEMSIFGARDLPELRVDPVTRGLGASNRSLGISLDFDPLFDEAWQAWLHVDRPVEVLDNLEAGETEPTLFLMAMPRTIALLSGNLGQAEGKDFAPELQPLYDHVKHIQRLEFGSLSPDMSQFYSNPRFHALAILKSDSTAKERDTAAAGVRNFLIGLRQGIVGKGGEIPAGLPALEKGKVAQLTTPEAGTLHYFYASDADNPYILFGVGLSADEVQAEVKKLDQPDTPETRPVIYMRAEPVGLLSLLTAIDRGRFEPLDISILAQRLGPMVLSVEPRSIGQTRVLHYTWELLQPPEL